MNTYILYTALRRLGAEADYAIPDRIKDGYGINESIIREAHEDGIDTILTCDNGISALSQISRAKEIGMTVLVTDHHEVPLDAEAEVIPPADAVVNPKQRDWWRSLKFWSPLAREMKSPCLPRKGLESGAAG